MGLRKVQFVNGEIYHIVIRAVEGIEMFKDEKDHLRMIHDLFEFNDISLVSPGFRIKFYKEKTNVTRKGHVTLQEKSESNKKRKMLVEILAFCLMPNHVHLLIRQLVDGGISKFMQKLGGYTGYYNRKYERKGHLLQGKFHAIHIRNNEQLKTVFVYIHTNPVAIIFPKWKEKGIKSAGQAMSYVEKYRWSSYPDYLGNKNFPSITSREFLLKVMGGSSGCRDFVNAWLKFKKELADFNYVAIE